MRKVKTLLLCIAMLFVLAACTADPATTGSTHGTYPPTSSTTKSTDPSSTPTTPAHSHVWVEASCTAPKTCTSCGVTEGAPLDHSWDAGVVTKEATEKTEGEKLYTCASCSTTRTEIIPALDHIHNYDAVITDPTCTAEGYTTYTCRCGDSYTADETTSWGHDWSSATCTTPDICKRCSVTQGEALGHSWKAATCTVAKTCTACNLTHGSALGHVESVDAAVDATCTKNGLTEGSHCSVCNEVLVEQQIVSAKGHIDAIDPAIAPTCTESGFTEGKHCSVCSKVLVAQKNVSATGHSEAIDAAVAATCTKTGLTEGKHCSVCNKVLVAQKTVNATGHQWIDAVCTFAKHCSVCGKKEGSELGHDFIATVIEPSCLEQGHTTNICRRCGTNYISDTHAALGHAWKEATCTVPKTCDRCSTTEGNALGHNWKAATCTDPQTCNKCGISSGSAKGHVWQLPTCTSPSICVSCGSCDGEPLGHAYNEHYVQEATCTTGGYIQHVCTSCRGYYITDETSALGHNWTPSTCTEPASCQRCNATDGSAIGHDFVNRICIHCNIMKASEGLQFKWEPGGDYYYVSGIGSCTDSVLVIPDTYNGFPVKKVDSSAFAGNTSITSVFIPSSVIYICDSAFRNCQNLTSVTFAENSNLTEIHNSAFRDCTSLVTITIPNKVYAIGDSAFYGCTALTSITIPDSVMKICSLTFYGCSNLTSITFGINSRLTSINLGAFYGCTSLANITIPDSVTSIGDSAFSGCTGLASITIPNGVTSIGRYAFNGCSSLVSITIPNSVTSIGERVFYDCCSLENVTIGNGVTSIGNHAFSVCSGLNSITFEGTIEQWNVITKGSGWNNKVPATEVICTDGKVKL